MRVFGSFIGGLMYGLLVFGIWGVLAGTYGLLGGWLAGFIIASTGWFINHYIGLIDNKPGAAAVDQAWGVMTAGVALGVFSGRPLEAAIPTIALCLIGGTLGGIASAMLQKTMAAEEKANA